MHSIMSEETYTGRVTKYNSKSGIGFAKITLKDGSPSSVFIHYSVIASTNKKNTFRYLVPGEIINITVDSCTLATSNSTLSAKALKVSGVNGALLRCDIPRPPKTEDK
jgi:cold shock CspA family protein